MCSPLISPLGAVLKSGSRAGLAMLSPAAALLKGGKKKTKPDRLQTLYPGDR